MLSPRATIASASLLVLAHVAVVAAIGPSRLGALLSDLIQLGLGVLAFLVILQASRRSDKLGRQFWKLVSVSYVIWIVAQATATYGDSFKPGYAAWFVNFLFSSYYIPIGLALLLTEDSDAEEVDWLRAIDVSQALLFWIAAYSYFFHVPSHVGEISPPLGNPYFLCYGVISCAFFLRSSISGPRSSRTLFRRAGLFLLVNAGADALYEYGPGKNLPGGAWFDLVWSLLLLMPLLTAATWTEVDISKPFEPFATNVNRRMKIQLFSFLYPVLTLCMAVPIVQGHVALASAFVLTSLGVSGLRLLITQHRLMATEEALRQDMTSRQLAEEAHRQIADRFAKAFRSNPEGILISTRDGGRILEANDAYVRMMGYARSELIGNTEEELNLWGSGGREQVIAKLQEQGVIRDYDTKFRSKGGRIKEAQISLEQIQVEEEACLLVSIRDVTESRHMGRQLLAAQKMEAVGRLAGGVAHDFNNLLTIISGYSTMQFDRTAPSDPVHHEAEQIKAAADRAASLTGQLLAFSRQQVLQSRRMNLNDIVHNIDKMLRRLIGEDIEILTVLAPNLGVVKVDPGQVDQVLMNLVVNARDAMPKGGKLTIQTENIELDESYAEQREYVKVGHYVMLAVSDSGTGMTPETQARLFEPFFTTKEPGKGTGLGLSMVYGIVKQSGGSIEVYSEPKHGTTIKIYLPRVDGVVEEDTLTAVNTGRMQGSERILLIEDDVPLRLMVVEILTSHGYSVQAMEKPEEVDLLTQHTAECDLLLTDVIMPKMNGRELAKRVGKRWPRIKVLYMSGYTMDAIVHHGVLDEGLFFLQKPFTPNALAAKVREVLDAPTRKGSDPVVLVPKQANAEYAKLK